MKKEDKKQKQKEIFITEIPLLVAKHLFPFMALYGHVIREKQAEPYGFGSLPLSTQFELAAHKLIQEKVIHNEFGGEDYLLFERSDLLLAHYRDGQPDNPDLLNALRRLQKIIESIGFEFYYKDSQCFCAKMKEPRNDI